MIDKELGRAFLLMILLVIVVYYVGTTNVVTSVSNAFVKVGYMLTGRNATTGQFANYPGGGGDPATF